MKKWIEWKNYFKKTALPLVDQKGNIIFFNKLALVRVPKGTTIRKSVARPQDWGGQGHLPGGAIQFERCTKRNCTTRKSLY